MQNEKYFHTSYIQRSSRQYADLKAYSRISKLVPAYDYKFPADYQYPEVFYVSRPDFVLPPFYKESALRRFIYFLLDSFGTFSYKVNLNNSELHNIANAIKKEQGEFILDLLREYNFEKFIEVQQKRRNEKCQKTMN